MFLFTKRIKKGAKVKKAFKLLTTVFALISLISCDKPKTYTVTWQNYDNSVLETDNNVKKGETPSYDGEIPTREDDEQYHYDFKEWSPELTEVSKDIVYVATYTATPIYQVRFLNYNNEVLYETKVLEGNVPTYQGNDPEREEDEQFSYSFSGWTPSLSAISEETTYTATYTSKPIVYYQVKFVNYDDSVLYETTVREGREAVYDGEAPTRPEDDEFKYEFEKWDKDLTSITSNLTVKAVYKYIPQENWGEIIFP